MSEQYGQIVGGFGSTQKLSGDVVPLKQIGGSVDRAATSYEKDYDILDNHPYLNDEEIIGLKSDGTLVFAGDYDSSNEEHANKLRKSHKYMSQWEDIVAISSLIHDGDYIGLKSDGTLLHTAGVTSVHGEDNHFNYINIDDCNDIIAISGRYLLRSNGDVVFIKDAKNLNDFLTNKNSKYLTQSTGINLFS